MQEIEVGDVVVKARSGDCNSAKLGVQYVVTQDSDGLCIGDKPGNMCHCISDWNLITKKGTNIMPDLKKDFALLFVAEPEKTFRKTGLTDNTDMLTPDGQTIFLSWLLNSKYAADFKTEVADKLLAEMEKK